MATRVKQTILAFNRSKSNTIIDPPIKSIMLAAKELVKPEGQKLTNFFSKKISTDTTTTQLSSPKKSSPARSDQLKSPSKKSSPIKAMSPIKKAFENDKVSKKRKSDEFETTDYTDETESDTSDGDSDESQPTKRTKLIYPHVEPFDFSLIGEVDEDEEFEKYLKFKTLPCPYCHKSIELINFKDHAIEHNFKHESNYESE